MAVALAGGEHADAVASGASVIFGALMRVRFDYQQTAFVVEGHADGRNDVGLLSHQFQMISIATKARWSGVGQVWQY